MCVLVCHLFRERALSLDECVVMHSNSDGTLAGAVLIAGLCVTHNLRHATRFKLNSYQRSEMEDANGFECVRRLIGQSRGLARISTSDSHNVNNI